MTDVSNPITVLAKPKLVMTAVNFIVVTGIADLAWGRPFWR